MQQQIQLEKNEQIKSRKPHEEPLLEVDERGFQIINDNQEIIQEDITQNYEQDFDSISNDSHKVEEIDNEIKEDFAQIQENIAQPQYNSSKEYMQNSKQKDTNSCPNDQLEIMKLTFMCEKMKLQINELEEKIKKYQKIEQKSKDDTLQELKKTVQANKQILQTLQLQQFNFFQNKVGKDSLCIQLMRSPEQFQQKLIQQIDKLKLLINLSNIETSKLKRQTKKNEEILPLQDENKEQFYQKYKMIKRQMDDKKEKYEIQAQKQKELDTKKQKLKEKHSEIEVALSQYPDIEKKVEFQQRIIIKIQELRKKRQAQMKKNTLIMHQIQNNCQTVTRNILQLRKQSNDYEQKISELDKKNIILQAESSKLMQKFQSLKQKIKQKAPESSLSQNNSSFVNDTELKPIPQLSNRRKYYSQAKNSFITNIFDNASQIDAQHLQLAACNTNERYIPKLIKNDKSFSVPSQNEGISKLGLQLGESSTSNTLKQFKLKLPSHTPQKSSKILNISLDISKNTPTKSKYKTDQSKLSITQRLERIQLLQREDRIYSHKLYQIKQQQQEKKPQLISKKQYNSDQILIKSINSEIQLPNYKKNVIKEGTDINQNLISSKTQASIQIINKRMRQPLHILPQSIDANQQKFIQTQRKKEPQSLQQEISTSRLTDRLNQKYFKKRIIYRQKKISQDYMKVLQQRGRKILQLDNESEA